MEDRWLLTEAELCWETERSRESGGEDPETMAGSLEGGGRPAPWFGRA